ncbi:MAG: DUF2817 domain-containing protein, partial [Oleibacter sp.]|nr:DUF2817 domain-containing protein [Thalassolituus sp.]
SEHKVLKSVIQRISHIKAALPELVELEKLIAEGQRHMRIRVPVHVEHKGDHLPFYVLEMGTTAPEAPVLALVGGVHGIERIGTLVILAFLEYLVRRLEWDPALQEQLNHVRLVFVPIVNPSGMAENTRANARGVDLMRNAPIEAEGKVPWLVGGQRISKLLPWYRGEFGASMEPESTALCDTILESLKNQKYCLSLDCHSGFGTRDRVWFPYARSTAPWPGIGAGLSLTELFESTYPHHGHYLFEPQAASYTTHGDLWDHIYDEHQKRTPGSCFIPMTLEMGSWLWVKKNPRHLFRYHSLFNPILPHRQERILRRHLALFDFLLSAARTMPQWAPVSPQAQQLTMQDAIARWYHSADGRITTTV